MASVTANVLIANLFRCFHDSGEKTYLGNLLVGLTFTEMKFKFGNENSEFFDILDDAFLPLLHST